MPVKFPHLFTGKRKPWRGILLYGVRSAWPLKSTCICTCTCEHLHVYIHVLCRTCMYTYRRAGQQPLYTHHSLYIVHCYMYELNIHIHVHVHVHCLCMFSSFSIALGLIVFWFAVYHPRCSLNLRACCVRGSFGKVIYNSPVTYNMGWYV